MKLFAWISGILIPNAVITFVEGDLEYFAQLYVNTAPPPVVNT